MFPHSAASAALAVCFCRQAAKVGKDVSRKEAGGWNFASLNYELGDFRAILMSVLGRSCAESLQKRKMKGRLLCHPKAT